MLGCPECGWRWKWEDDNTPYCPFCNAVGATGPDAPDEAIEAVKGALDE